MSSLLPPDGTRQITLGGRKRLPLRPLTAPAREDGIFAALRRDIPNHQAQDARKNAWILEAIWILIDKRVSVQQDPAKDQSLIQRLGRAIAAILKGDMRRQVEEDGAEVETLIGSDPPFHREYWHRLKGWYWAAVNLAPPPAQVKLKQITAERVDLYRYVPPLGEISPFPLNHSSPLQGDF